MASRISQMRNGTQSYPQMPQQQLNESIERTRNLMQEMRNIPNTETMIMNLFQQNPQLQMLSPMLRNGNSLESIAKTMAQTRGIDINDVINKLLR